jgi:dTDP-4-amino-4,6-dideoxygalactose transaminase
MRPDASDFIPIASPELGPEEEKAVLRVLRSGMLAQGSEVAALEEEFAHASGVGHAVAVANGTAALQVALHIAGIGPGHQVLVPSFTFAATANAVLAVGAEPVFVDIDQDYLIDLNDAAAKVTERTRAIMPVHLYGLMVDMSELQAFADDHQLTIVEDAAQAHLATRDGKAAGATGIGAFSLYATKNMTTGEGGMVTTNDPKLAEAARLFRNHGMPVRYQHLEWGLNLRMTDLQAAIGREQLRKLEASTKVRSRQAANLLAGLPGVFRVPRVPDGARHVFHQFTVAVREDMREQYVEGFREAGIGVDIYYPTPLHRQPAFATFRRDGDCLASERAAREVLSLPIHPRVGDRGVARILETAEHLARGSRL